MALDGYDVRGFQVGGLLRRGSAVVWRSRRKGRGADFVWRALDVGWDINYRANLLLRHPLTAASLHAVCNRNTGRNRVWLANRHLPTILVPIYLATWIAYTIRQRPPCPASDHGGPGPSKEPSALPTTTTDAVADRMAHDPPGVGAFQRLTRFWMARIGRPRKMGSVRREAISM